MKKTLLLFTSLLIISCGPKKETSPEVKPDPLVELISDYLECKKNEAEQEQEQLKEIEKWETQNEGDPHYHVYFNGVRGIECLVPNCKYLRTKAR